MPTYTFLITLLITFLIMLIFLMPTYTVCESKPIIGRMIYHSSILSPFYDPTATVEDLAQRETYISMERLRNTFGDDSMVPVQPSNIGGIIQRAAPLFLVEMYIGEGQYKERLILDTGTSLLWVFCDRPHDYVYSKSISYVELICGNPLCFDSGYSTCQDLSAAGCEYLATYGTGYSEGYLAEEKFKFDRDSVMIENVLFGCAQSAELPYERAYDGMLGLGQGPTSIINQLGYFGFSYCLGNLSDTGYLNNTLLIWNTDIPALDSQYSTTLLITKTLHYGAQLVEISIDSESVHIPFPPGLEAVATMDTGATNTYLTAAVYQEFEKAIIKTMEGRLFFRSDAFENKLCYEGNLQRDLQWFPTISFHFTKDTVMDVGHEHLFVQQNSSVICLAVLPRNSTLYNIYSANIIGVRLQQYFYVSYNLVGRQLNIKKFDCEKVT